MPTLEETLRANILAGAIAQAETGVESYPHGDGTVQLTKLSDRLKLLTLLGAFPAVLPGASATTYAEVET